MELSHIKEKFAGKKNIWDINFKAPTFHRELSMMFGSKHRGSVRLSMGRFYTPQEWESIREKVLKTPLP